MWPRDDLSLLLIVVTQATESRQKFFILSPDDILRPLVEKLKSSLQTRREGPSRDLSRRDI